MISPEAGKNPVFLPRHGTQAVRPGGQLWDPVLSTIHIIQIDNFVPTFAEDATCPQDINFNHGETVANMLRSGGADPGLSGWIALESINVGQPDGQKAKQVDRWAARISEALVETIRRVKLNPDSIDVVCIALQSPQDTPQIAVVRKHIDTLLQLDVPVVLAAGNRSDNPDDPLNFAPNFLASPSAFTVQATQHGNLLYNSKPGHISAEGRSTSFAVPAVAPLLGYYKSQGHGNAEIKVLISERVAFHHGTLPAAIGQNAYSAEPTQPLIESVGLLA